MSLRTAVVATRSGRRLEPFRPVRLVWGEARRQTLMCGLLPPVVLRDWSVSVGWVWWWLSGATAVWVLAGPVFYFVHARFQPLSRGALSTVLGIIADHAIAGAFGLHAVPVGTVFPRPATRCVAALTRRRGLGGFSEGRRTVPISAHYSVCGPRGRGSGLPYPVLFRLSPRHSKSGVPQSCPTCSADCGGCRPSHGECASGGRRRRGVGTSSASMALLADVPAAATG